MKTLFALALLIPCISLAQVGGTAKAVRADTILGTYLIKVGSDTVETKAVVRMKVSAADSTTWLPTWADIGAYHYLIPTDSTNFRAYSTSLYAPITGSTAYLKNADSTSIRNYSTALYLKNADSVSFRAYSSALYQPAGTYLVPGDSSTQRTYSNSLYLKNADSTTQRTYSTSLYAPKVSPVITGNPDFSGSSTFRTHLGAGTVKSASDGYLSVVASETTGVAAALALKAPITSAALVTPSIGVATGTSLALGGATLGTNSLAVTGTANISGNTVVGGYVSAVNFYGASSPYILDNPGVTGFKLTRTVGIQMYRGGTAGLEAMRLDTLGRIGLGTTTPYHLLSGYTTGTAGFNLTHSVNTTRSSAAQESDSSAINMSFTASGKPQFNMTGATGTTLFAIDSLGRAKPGDDNATTLGTTANRFSTVYATGLSAYGDALTLYSGALTGQLTSIGFGINTYPYHALDVKTTSTAAFNITNSTYNTTVSSAAQEADTSAVNVTFSPGGDPELTLKNAVGAITAKIDSNGTATFAGAVNLGTLLRLPLRAVAVGDSVVGNIYFRSADTCVVIWNGTTWKTVVDAGD